MVAEFVNYVRSQLINTLIAGLVWIGLSFLLGYQIYLSSVLVFLVVYVGVGFFLSRLGFYPTRRPKDD